MTSRLDLVGQKFNRLTVLEFSHVDNKNAYWRCQCDCGKEHITAGYSLKRDEVKSCGCLKVEQSKKTVKYAQRAKKLPDGIAEFNTLLSRYKQQSSDRGLPFNINAEDFRELIKSNCHYCGIEPLQKARSNNINTTPYVYNGIDRKDNTKGYELDNCVPCCYICNRAKRELSYDQFMEWINRIRKG